MSAKEDAAQAKKFDWKAWADRGLHLVELGISAQSPKAQAEALRTLMSIVVELSRSVFRNSDATATLGPNGSHAPARFNPVEIKMVAIELLGEDKDEFARKVSWAANEIEHLRHSVALREKLLDEVMKVGAANPGGIPPDLLSRIRQSSPRAGHHTPETSADSKDAPSQSEPAS